MSEATDRCIPFIVFKACALLCLVSITAWQCSNNVIDYLSYDAVTAVSRSSENSAEFPMVTLCNYNRWKSSLLTTEELNEAVSEYDSFNSKVADAPKQKVVPLDVYSLIMLRGWHLIDDYNSMNFSPNRNNTLLQCSFLGRSCNSKFFRHRMTSYGNCYTFNSNITVEDIESIDGAANFINLPLAQTHASEEDGLRLFIDVEAFDYSESPTINGKPLTGMKILVHSRNEQPNPDASGISVGPGSFATIGIRRTEYRNIPPPEGQCDYTRRLSYYDTYTLSACEAECKMVHVENNCSCRPFYYPSDKICSLHDTLFCSKAVTDAINRNFDQFCNCPEPCAYEEFQPTASYAPFPSLSYSAFFENSFNYSPQYIEKNIVGISVYFSDIKSTIIQQFPSKTLTSLLNDLGGTSGLYIGFSFMSIIELTQAATQLLFAYMEKRKNTVQCISTSTETKKSMVF